MVETLPEEVPIETVLAQCVEDLMRLLHLPLQTNCRENLNKIRQSVEDDPR